MQSKRKAENQLHKKSAKKIHIDFSNIDDGFRNALAALPQIAPQSDDNGVMHGGVFDEKTNTEYHFEIDNPMSETNIGCL